jgi:hypothetical protein
MGKNIKIQKTVYQKDSFGKVVDRGFKSFVSAEEAVDGRTVKQFFKDYEDLYLDIPVEGDGESHRYLVERSSELLDLEDNLQDIQPLLDEIAELREQLLESLTKNIDLEIEMANLKAGTENGDS